MAWTKWQATCRLLVREGVDTIKLNISGNQTIPNSRSDQNVMNDDEIRTAAQTAHAHGKRIAAHARAAASIKLALKHGVDILYHCEYADEECLDLLEAARDRIFVAPAIGLLHNLMYEAEPWGITYQKAEAAGVVHQFECAQKVFAELRKRGVRVLVGGDYGFPWTPHGTNARDLEHFVRFFGYSDAEALVAATRTRRRRDDAGRQDRRNGARVSSPICWLWPANRTTTSGCCSQPATSSWS